MKENNKKKMVTLFHSIHPTLLGQMAALLVLPLVADVDSDKETAMLISSIVLIAYVGTCGVASHCADKYTVNKQKFINEMLKTKQR